jgi:hypothetical protein
MKPSELSRRLALGVFFTLLLFAQRSVGQQLSQTSPVNRKARPTGEPSVKQKAMQYPKVGQSGSAGAASVDVNGAQSIFSPEQWLSVGPFGIPLSNNNVQSGQVNTVVVHPRDDNTLYIGAAEGGVWKTANGGASWRPLTDFQLVRDDVFGTRRATVSIGSLAIDPTTTETVYAGTGDPNPATGIFIGRGLGVFRSTDGGNNWTVTGKSLFQIGCGNAAMSAATVNRLVAATGQPTVVFAATNLGVFSYRDDSNDCWKRLTSGLPPSGNAIDLALDRFRGALYVAFFSQGIFKSNDPLGQSWSKLTNGIPSTGFGRIALTFGGRSLGFGAPAQLIYAGFNGPGTYRLFKTANGGASWTELPSPPNQGQLDFNNAIAVGLFNSDEIYVGQVNLWRATDGGRGGGVNSFTHAPIVTDRSWFDLSCCLVDNNPFREGLDLHSDIHEIVFAPSSSFVVSPSQLQVIFVANDGGVTKGIVNSDGVVTWQALTQGLAISQIGTIGLAPQNPSATFSGIWHNGNAMTLTGVANSLAVAGGDGFQASVDAATALTVYHNCNAGVNGSICRAKLPSFTSAGSSEEIFHADRAAVHWSDPYRPGDLFRLNLQSGFLFRVSNANTKAASTLRFPQEWDVIDPLTTKTGKTTTIAFRSIFFENRPIYYIGTTTGQIWRGSPEAHWTKVCECGLPVRAISPDLVRNERIFVVFDASQGPGRVKELTLRPDGTWNVGNIDKAFLSEVPVNMLSLAADPLEKDGTTIYVGTDVGVYRGHLRPDPVIQPTLPDGIVNTILDWTWTRSPGVPNVAVPDMEVHQGPQFRNLTGVIRAATWGRGVYQLRRSALGTFATFPLTLDVEAMQIGGDGAPPTLTATIAVVTSGKKFTRDAPFQLTLESPTEVTLEAPAEISASDGRLKFVGWAIPGKLREVRRQVTLKISETTKAIAYYELKARLLSLKAEPPHVLVSAGAEQVCAQGFTHQLNLSWERSGGLEPVIVVLEITYPDKHIETIELKPLEGSQQYPLNSPQGGEVRIKMTAKDSSNASTSAGASVQLQPCR